MLFRNRAATIAMASIEAWFFHYLNPPARALRILQY